MDNTNRNQIIGMVLIGALLFAYFTFFSTKPTQENKNPQAVTQDSSSQAKPNKPQRPAEVVQVGSFEAAQKGTAKDIILQNDKIKITFSSKGGNVKAVQLKDYKTYDQKPLIFFGQNDSKMKCMVNTPKGEADLYQLYYTPTKNGNKLTFRLRLDGGGEVLQTYTLQKDSYLLDYNIQLNGLKGKINSKSAKWIWKASLPKTEEDMELSRMKSTINAYLKDDGLSYLTERSDSKQEKSFDEPISWVVFQQKFYLGSIIALGDNQFTSGDISTTIDPDSDKTVKNYKAELSIPIQNLTGSKNQYQFYFGPNKYNILKNIDTAEDFERNVGIGWFVFRWVNKLLIIPIFYFLQGFITNYGILILVLVLIIKMLLLPLVFKSQLSMANMRVLKPELDEIKERTGGDMQAAQAEQTALYRQVGFNPLSGCIPTILQIPITFAMFLFFPNAIELRQKSFLWAKDLSTYDSILNLPFDIPFYGDHVSLFTLLMTGSTILYTYYNNQNSSQVQGPMKNIGYFMPLIFMFVLNSYPAGLTLYYFCSNLVSIAQTIIIRQFVDDKKIRAKIEANKKKNKNKEPGAFQKKLDEAMKARQQTKAKSKNNKNNKDNEGR